MDWYSLLLGSPVPPSSTRAMPSAPLPARWSPASMTTPAARAAEEAFDRVHVRHELPEDVDAVRFAAVDGDTVHLPALLAQAFGISTSEARRGLAQGAVKLDGEPVGAGALDLPADQVDGRVLQFGKRRFARVEIA